MRIRCTIVAVIGIILVIGCQSGNAIVRDILATTSDDSIESGGSLLSQLPSPAPKEDAGAEPAAMAEEPPALPEQEESVPPLPLYFLGDQAIWLLEPGDAVIEQVTPDGQGIISFDVWPGDGRIAYGTSGGQLYVIMPGQEALLLHDVTAEAPYLPMIGSVAWSPDGTRLAYTVGYDDAENAWRDAGFPSHPSGLWLLDVENATPTWLLSNHYLNAGETDVKGLRSLSDPVWAPDGTALILTGHLWEGCDIFWLDPVAPDLDEVNLHDFPDDDIFWGSGSWTDDSQSILLSKMPYTIYGSLVLVDRASLATTYLIDVKPPHLVDGAAEELWVGEAQELPSGIVFSLMEQMTEQLYLGYWDEEGFAYSPVGPESLCRSGIPGHVEWNSTAQWGVLVCGYGPENSGEQDEVHIVTLDGENIDITSYLNPLAGTNALKVLWGG